MIKQAKFDDKAMAEAIAAVKSRLPAGKSLGESLVSCASNEVAGVAFIFS